MVGNTFKWRTSFTRKKKDIKAAIECAGSARLDRTIAIVTGMDAGSEILFVNLY
jgi:hypothetical protein